MIGRIKPECRDTREQLEQLRAGAEVRPGSEVELHLAQCAACGEYVQLQAWTRQVVQAGELEVVPPLMSAVWASIHRASEQAWDSALTRSFRYLLPYMVAIVALIALVGGLTSTQTPTPVQAASTAYAVLNQPEPSGLANVMTTANLPAQTTADMLRIQSHR